MEPSRCCISSIALVLLKTGINHNANVNGERHVTVDYAQMGTAQKLLLFWRKPAVSCLPSSWRTTLTYLLSANVGGMALRSTLPNQVSPKKRSNCGQGASGPWNSVWYVARSLAKECILNEIVCRFRFDAELWSFLCSAHMDLSLSALSRILLYHRYLLHSIP